MGGYIFKPRSMGITASGIEQLRQASRESLMKFWYGSSPSVPVQESEKMSAMEKMEDELFKLQEENRQLRSRIFQLERDLEGYRRMEQTANWAFNTGAPVIFQRKPNGSFEIGIDPSFATVPLEPKRPLRKFRIVEA